MRQNGNKIQDSGTSLITYFIFYPFFFRSGFPVEYGVWGKN